MRIINGPRTHVSRPRQPSRRHGPSRWPKLSRPRRELFEEVDDALNQPLSRLMWQGPEADLTLTENAQPALMAVSLAVMRVLERDGKFDWGKHVALVAGHSLGEYSALAAAGAVSRRPTPRAC